MKQNTQAFLNKAQNFINSTSFVYAVALAVAVIWFLGWELAGFALLIITAGITLLVQRNATPFVVITSLIIYCVSLQQLPVDLKTGNLPENFEWFIAYLALLFGFLAVCIFLHKKKYPRQNQKYLDLSASFVVCIVSLIVAGLFSTQFKLSNNFFVVLMYGALFVVYVILSSGDMPNFKNLISHVIFAAGLVVAFEFICKLLQSDNLAQDIIVKNFSFGWGIPNYAAIVMCFAIIMGLYLFATTDNLLYFLCAIVFSFLVVLTLSRGNILSLAIVLPFVGVYAIYKCNCKKRAIATLALVVFAIVVFIICNFDLIAEIMQAMFNRGLDDNGRNELWGACVQLFKQNPLFGMGYYDPVSGIMYTPHAIVIHLLACMGVFGLVAFGYHYYRKYFVFLSHNSTFKWFGLATCFILVFYTVIDMNFYLVYQNILVFGVLEAFKQEREELGIAKNTKIYPLWATVCALVVGLGLTVLATFVLTNSVFIENSLFMLQETQYFVSLALYIVGGILFFASCTDLWQNNIKPKLAKN